MLPCAVVRSLDGNPCWFRFSRRGYSARTGLEMTVNTTLKTLLVFGLILAAPLGCATKPQPAPVVYAPPPPPPPPPPPSPARKIKLVMLPTEKFLLPNIAAALDDKLAKAQIPGVDDRVVAAVSMATAQGQSECVQADNACLVKVAGLLSGDRLLWAEMERAGKAKKKAPIKVVLTLFDAEKGAPIGRAEEIFRNDVADGSLDTLIGKALSGAGPTAPPPEPSPMLPPPPLPSAAPAPGPAPAFVPAAAPAPVPAAAAPVAPVPGGK
jgi:hypothetical protein